MKGYMRRGLALMASLALALTASGAAEELGEVDLYDAAIYEEAPAAGGEIPQAEVPRNDVPQAEAPQDAGPSNAVEPEAGTAASEAEPQGVPQPEQGGVPAPDSGVWEGSESGGDAAPAGTAAPTDRFPAWTTWM